MSCHRSMTASKQTTTVQIVFAPLPEEERDVERSAAKEFAARTAEQFRAAIAATTGGDGDINNNTHVQIHHMADWDEEQFVASMTSPSFRNSSSDDQDDVVIEGGNNNTVVLFLISCGPDGSVHRSVRKTTKWLKEQQQQIKSQEESKEHEHCVTPKDNTTTTTTAMVALLGHAVCKTSAEQMADEVYSSGRRLAKSIQILVPPCQSSSTRSTTAPKFLVETQIELEAPEEKFDGWIQSWVVELIGE